MKSFIISAIIILLIIPPSFASDLKMPREIKKAYDKNTRSYDGKPGINYWQNFSEYNIKAEIDPNTRLLTGSEKIVYLNNSPDTLKNIVLKLYQDMYKKGAARNRQLNPVTVTDGVIVSKLTVDNASVSLNPDDKKISYQGTNLIIKLTSPLPPKENIAIEIDWSFVIPKGTDIRIGTYGELTFFVGYWYPKIAVYDDILGWDLLSYNAEHEFYFDYSDINVEIKVPKGFGIWATGMLQNPEEVLNEPYLERYSLSLTSDNLINIVSRSDSGKEIYKSQNGFTTFKYSVKNISDFAFGMSDFYLWDGTSIELEPGKRVGCFSAYNPSSDFFTQAAEMAKRSIEFFSKEMPGVIYPYPQITVFNGDGGMEFPMIVNDGQFSNKVNDVYVTTHEISHMYFPFYVGTNETRYGWMDEGMAYFLPWDLQIELSEYDHRTRAAVGFSRWAGNEMDIPMIFPSILSRDPHLSILSYYKSALAFEMLESALGDELFKKCLNEFISRWNGKHPTPWDMFYTFEDVVNHDLSWFWKPWFFESHIPDLAIKDVKNENNKTSVLVENVGNLPVPIDLTLTFEDGIQTKLTSSTLIWQNGDKEVWLDVDVKSKVKTVELTNKNIPDADVTNNSMRFEHYK
ncbi:MAG: M1 family metallopeptidase [Ignavibacterium sp.]|jgi:aminopeptidase N|nr:M1 family metallopeptidase [Ignavibacterium sp.]